MSDIRQAKPYAAFLESLRWKTQRHPQNRHSVAVRPLLPLFGILKLQRVLHSTIDFAWLQKLHRKHLIFASYLELADRHMIPVVAKPNTQSIAAFTQQFSRHVKKFGYVPIAHGMLPSKTQIIDLTLSMDSILKSMKPKTRYNISVAQKKRRYT